MAQITGQFSLIHLFTRISVTIRSYDANKNCVYREDALCQITLIDLVSRMGARTLATILFYLMEKNVTAEVSCTNEHKTSSTTLLHPDDFE